MSLKLWIANKNYSSWSLRPWLLLSQLGIPFEESLVPFSHVSSNPEFGRFSPTAKVPVLEEGDTLVWESLAIIEYLGDSHAEVWPEESNARAWARSAAAEMHAGFTALRNRCPMNCALRLSIPEIVPDLAQDIQRLDALWCEGLERFGGPCLAGAQFTGVDAFYAPVVLRCQGFGLTERLSPPAQAYIARITALDAMQKWQADAIRETPESGHEADSLANGVLEHDLRKEA